MKKISFNSYDIEMKMNTELRGLYKNWAYYEEILWSDYDEDVPDLDQKFSISIWNGSVTMPSVNAKRTLLVSAPFSEEVGNEFYGLYEPANISFNRWHLGSKQDISECSIVKCKLEKILKKDDNRGFIVVSVLEVIPLERLYEHYPACESQQDIEAFENIPLEYIDTSYESAKWLVKSFDMQGDCGSSKWIYIDEKGIKHLVMESWSGPDESILYIGNIVEDV